MGAASTRQVHLVILPHSNFRHVDCDIHLYLAGVRQVGIPADESPVVRLAPRPKERIGLAPNKAIAAAFLMLPHDTCRPCPECHGMHHTDRADF